MLERSLYPRMVAALVALVGLLDSVYLSMSRLKLSNLGCPVGGGCDTVQNHPWSSIPPESGIPIAYIGLVGYALMFLLSMLALHRDYIGSVALPVALLVVGMGAVAMGLYLMSVQVFVINALCFWCVLSGIFGLLFAGAALLDWRSWSSKRTKGLALGTLKHSDV